MSKNITVKFSFRRVVLLMVLPMLGFVILTSVHIQDRDILDWISLVLFMTVVGLIMSFPALLIYALIVEWMCTLKRVDTLLNLSLYAGVIGVIVFSVRLSVNRGVTDFLTMKNIGITLFGMFVLHAVIASMVCRTIYKKEVL